MVIALDTGSPAIALGGVVALAAISVVDGIEGAVTGEDVAIIPITLTEDTPIPTLVFIRTTFPITLTGIGQLSAIRMEGATGLGSRTIIIEGG